MLKKIYAWMMLATLLVNTFVPTGLTIAEEMANNGTDITLEKLDVLNQHEEELTLELTGVLDNTNGKEKTIKLLVSSPLVLNRLIEEKTSENIKATNEEGTIALTYTTTETQKFNLTFVGNFPTNIESNVLEVQTEQGKKVSTSLPTLKIDTTATTEINETLETNSSTSESKSTEESVETNTEQTKKAEVNNKKSTRQSTLGTKIPSDTQIITDVKITDLSGQELTQENPLEIDNGIRIHLNWALPETLEVNNNDTYEFNLPDVLKLNGTIGPIDLEKAGISYGTFTVDKTGHVTMVFNENANANNVGGTMKIETWFDEQKVKEKVQQAIDFPIGEENKEVFVNFKPKSGNEMTKTGEIDHSYNGQSAAWQVDINTELKKLVDAKVTDEIPAGMTLNKESLVVYQLEVNIDGSSQQGETLSKDNYTVSYDTEGNPTISFDKLTEDQKNGAYRIAYQTDIDLSKVSEKGSWTNKATFTNNHTNPIIKDATVKTNYGLDIEKKAGKYNGNKGIDWVINYNYSGKKIPAKEAILTDRWDEKVPMTLEKLVIYPVTLDSNGVGIVSKTPLRESEYQIIEQTDHSFVLKFTHDVVQPYQIQYQTKLTNVITTNGTVSNEVKTGTGKSYSENGSYTQKNISKGLDNSQYVNSNGDKVSGMDGVTRTIPWKVTINENNYMMNNLVVSDSFKDDGLSLIEETIKIMDGTKQLEKGKDYVVEIGAPTKTDTGGFTVNFLGEYQSTDKKLILTYQTHYEQNSNKDAIYNNKALVQWNPEGNEYKYSSSADGKITINLMKTNGLKEGKYNAKDQTIAWDVYSNYARLDLPADSKIEDELDSSQYYVEGSLKVYHYTINKDTTINKTNKTDIIPASDYTVTYENGKISVKFKHAYKNPDKTTIGLSFETKFKDDWINKDKVPNTAVVDNSSESYKLSASAVTIPYGGSYGDKSGVWADNNIDWTIKLNPNGSKIKNYQLVDTLGTGSVLLPDTFKLYHTTINDKNETNLGSEVSKEEAKELYTIETITNQATGEQKFTLTFNKEITEGYVLKYSTYIDATGTVNIGNKYQISGNGEQTIQAEKEVSTKVQMSGASGTGSGIRSKLQIEKQDEYGHSLAGASFELWNKNQTVLLREGTVDENGLLILGGLRSGDYVLKEVKAPKGYVIPQDYVNGFAFYMEVATDGELQKIVVKDPKTKVILKKVNENKQLIKGAEFTIYNKDTKEKVKSVTLSSGQLTVEDLAVGNYYIEETKAATGYIQSKETVDFEIKINDNGTQTIPTVSLTNYKGSAKLIKENDQGKPLSGAVFKVIDENGKIIQENIKSSSNGEVVVSGLAPGKYRFIETKAPVGYLLNTKEVAFEISGMTDTLGKPETVLAGTLVNYQGSAKLTKVSEEKKALPGATFKLVDSKGAVVKEKVTSNEKGEVVVSDLAPGSYTFVEVQAPTGYSLNTEELSFEIDASAQECPTVKDVGVFVNYQGKVSFIKVDKDKKALEGATFKIVKKETPEKIEKEAITDEKGQVTFDGLAPGDYLIIEMQAPTGYVINATPIEVTVQVSSKGKPVITGKEFVNYKGSAKFIKVNEEDKPLAGAVFKVVDTKGQTVKENIESSVAGEVLVSDLAPGNYKFIETKAAPGYVRNTTEVTFEIKETSAGMPSIVNLEKFVNYKGSVKLTKTDETGAPLEQAHFEVVNQAGEVIAEAISNADGIVNVDGLSPGDYYFRETKAPENYIRNTSTIPFTIQETAEESPKTIDAGQFINYKGTAMFNKINETGESLKGATFKVIDNQGNDIISEVTSNEQGVVSASGLAPGTYQFVETKAPKGYIRNTQPIPFTIKSESKEKDVVVAIPELYMNYKGRSELIKLSEAGKALVNAEFEVRDDEDKLVEAHLISDEEGKVTIDGLAPGHYYFVETKAPKGYILDNTPVLFEITASENGQPETVKTNSLINYQGSAILEKTDEMGEPLLGAEFKLIDEAGEQVGPILTSDEAGQVKGINLAPGNYQFIEIKAPIGYLLNSLPVDITIDVMTNVAGNKKPIVVSGGTFKNYKGSAKLIKTDETGQGLSGAVFNVETIDGEMVKEDLISNEQGEVNVSDLAPGTYHFVETKAPTGYIRNTDKVSFEIKESADGKPATVNVDDFVNYQGKVSFTKVNEEGQPLADTIFQLVNSETGEVVHQVESDEDGNVRVEGLAPGEYRFEEIKATKDYLVNTEPINFSIAETHSGKVTVKEVQKTFVNYQGVAELWKVDEHNEPLQNAEFRLFFAGTNEVVQEHLVSDEEGRVFARDLAPGTYEFEEVKAPTGYIKNSQRIAFTINQSAKGQPVTVKMLTQLTNYQGTAQLIKTNKEGTPLKGAEFKVLNDKQEIVDEGLVSDEEGIVLAKNLAPGTYSFIETKAPTGYLINTQPISFTIKDEANGQPDKVDVGQFINYKGSVSFTKVNEAGQALSGVKFQVYNEQDDLIVGEVASDETGKVTVRDLAPGTYYFVETQALEGYIRNTELVEIEVTDKYEGEPQVFMAEENFINYQGRAKLIKTGWMDALLEGARFSLYQVNEEQELEEFPLFEELQTNAKGEIEVTHIAPGHYAFVETQAPAGYLIDQTPIFFTIEVETAGKPETVLAGIFNNEMIPSGETQGMIEEIPETEKLTEEIILLPQTNKPTEIINTVSHTDKKVSISSKDNKTKLPQTGEKANNFLPIFGGVVILAGIFIGYIRNKSK